MPIEIQPPRRNIVTCVFTGAFSDQEFENARDSMTLELERARRSGRRIGFLSISTPDSLMTSKQRVLAAEWAANELTRLRSACVGQAVVVPGAVQKGVFTAILWMVTYPVPIRAFRHADEAEAWVRSLLFSFADTPRI